MKLFKSLYAKIKKIFNKSILIKIFLMIMVLNLISTFFIFEHLYYINTGFELSGEPCGIFSDWIRRGTPIPIRILIYEISSRSIKFNFFLNILKIFLLITMILMCFIPIYFASRIIYLLKPLFSMLDYNSINIFLIFWIIINYFILILLLKKINLTKTYKIEIFIIPIIFNICYFLSAYEFTSISMIIFICYLFHFVFLIVDKLSYKS